MTAGGRARPRPVDLALAGLLALGAATAWVGGSDPATPDPAAAVAVRFTVAAAPACAGWFLVRQASSRGEARLGRTMLVAALLTALFALTGTDRPWLALVGQLAALPMSAVSGICLLALPGGRLRSRLDRGIAAGAVVAAVLWVPAVLVTTPEALPVPWRTICPGGCTPSPSPVASSSGAGPAFATLVGIAMFVLTVLAIWSVHRFARAASPVVRRTISVTLGLATARAALHLGLAVALEVDRLGPDAEAAWRGISALALACAWLSIPIGTVSRRLASTAALQGLLAALADARPEEFDGLLQRALRDPTAQLALIDRDGLLRGPDDQPVALEGRTATPVPGGRLILHDPAWRDELPLVVSAGTVVATACLEAERQEALERAADDLRASRARTAEARLAERRRIERRLRVGARQELVAAQARLEEAHALADAGDPRAASALTAARDGVGSALESVRDLARGVYPASLRASGIAVALREAAASGALPPLEVAGEPGPLPPRVEEHAYFVCADAAVALGSPTAPVEIALQAIGARVLVTASTASAPGDAEALLVPLRDRVEAVGGALAIARRADGRLAVACALPVPEAEAEPTAVARVAIVAGA